MGNWVPYPKFLAMFEGQQPRDMATNGSQGGIDVHVASAQPEKLKVAIILSVL